MVPVFVQIMSLLLSVKSLPSKSQHNKCSSHSLQACREMMKLSCQKGIVANFTQSMWEFHALNKIVLLMDRFGRCVWVKGAVILIVMHSCSAVCFWICQRPTWSASFILMLRPFLGIGHVCQTLLNFTAQSWLAVPELPDFENTTFSFTWVSRHLVDVLFAVNEMHFVK